MRTTLRINDGLLKQAKKRAADEGRTLTSLVEDGLALILAKTKERPKKPLQLPVSKASGGVMAGVDLNRSCELEEAMNKL
ncbi:MAG: hypothetical protein WBG50_09235 [Desulfomonilaceae bacterium]